MSFSPYQHQIDAQNIMKNMEIDGNGGFLADAMGLGKTATMAMFLKSNKIQNRTDLIVCPFSVIQNWKREIMNVKDYPTETSEPSILIYHGPKRERELAHGTWDYVITTYSIIGTGELSRKRWGRVVLDESHTIKNGLRGGANKPKCAIAAFEIGRRSEKNWCISGTPFNNRMSDIAAQCYFLGTAPFDDPKWWRKPSDVAVSEWRSNFVLQRTKDGLLKPPQYNDISVSPFSDETKIINTMRSQAQENFKRWKNAHGYRKLQLQAKVLALITKLRIISNSFYCGEPDVNGSEVMANCAKIFRMVTDIKKQMEEDPKKGLVVFSQFTSFLDIMEQVLESEIPDVEVLKFNGTLNAEKRDQVVTHFNESRSPRILLISLLAGGVGLSLHHGSSTVFISEPYYNPFMEKQAEERVHRLGQQRQVQVFRYVMDNSVETWINGMKSRKMEMASTIGLVKNSGETKGFSFADLSDLFSDYVSFTTPDGKPIYKKRKEPVEQPLTEIKNESESESESESEEERQKRKRERRAKRERKRERREADKRDTSEPS